MAKSPAFARIKSDVLAIVAAIPKGRVASAADLGRQIDVPARHVAFILTTLDEGERAVTPWWRWWRTAERSVGTSGARIKSQV